MHEERMAVAGLPERGRQGTPQCPKRGGDHELASDFLIVFDVFGMRGGTRRARGLCHE